MKKYKLYYLNKFGQLSYPNGKAILRTEIRTENDYFEVYADLDKAKAKAKIYVAQYPIMSCVIFDEEDNQEIIIEAEKEKVEQAWKEENEKNRPLFEAYEKKQKRFQYFVIGTFILVCVTLIGFKLY